MSSDGKVVGEVVEIFIARGGGQPVQRVDAIEAIKDRGLAGDRFVACTSYWSGVDECQVTLIALEGLEEIAAMTEVSVMEGQHRRNIVTLEPAKHRAEPAAPVDDLDGIARPDNAAFHDARADAAPVASERLGHAALGDRLDVAARGPGSVELEKRPAHLEARPPQLQEIDAATSGVPGGDHTQLGPRATPAGVSMTTCRRRSAGHARDPKPAALLRLEYLRASRSSLAAAF